MKSPEELELEVLLSQLAATEEGRAQLLEEHRQLEKDLLRLADPSPPDDFVQQVMARVEQAPASAPARSDQWMAGGIVFTAALSAVLALGLGGEGLGGVGVQFTQGILRLHDTTVGVASGLGALWRAAALPLTLGLGLALGFSLLAFKRVVLGGFAQVKAAP